MRWIRGIRRLLPGGGSSASPVDIGRELQNQMDRESRQPLPDLPNRRRLRTAPEVQYSEVEERRIQQIPLEESAGPSRRGTNWDFRPVVNLDEGPQTSNA